MKKTPEELRNEFWKNDLMQGGIIHSQYRQIKDILSVQDMQWVQQQYRLIKKHAIEQTDFYKDRNLEEEFPVVNKSTILEHYEEHKAREGYDFPLHTSSTSGSTGTPISVIQDYKKRNRTIADLKVFGELCDYPSHECMVFLRVLSDSLRRTPEQEERENIYYIDSANLDPDHLRGMLNEIYRRKPRILFSYASTLVILAKFVKAEGITADSFSMKSVLTAGEGVSESDRILLEEAFGCTVYRRYSDMELGILGQDTGNGSAYVLNHGSFYFECLKLESDEPAAYGEVGRIVITDLFNYAFPMIRYDTGDLGIMDVLPGEKLPVLKEIHGRKRDCVYTTSGQLLSPAKISVSMWGITGVDQWQFIQEGAKAYTLKLNCSKEITNVSGILNKLQAILGDDAEISVEYVEGIAVLSSNKFRAVICNYIK